MIAPDSFKGTLTAERAAAALGDGWQDAAPGDRIELVPQADGGEGTLEAVAAAVPDTVRRRAGIVTGPDGRPVQGRWLELPGGHAVVELAQSSGLPLMQRPDALHATTRGLGEVIGAALDAGAVTVTIALGGSASTDLGAGALVALGLRMRDAAGREVRAGGADLVRVAEIDRSGLRAPPAGGAVLLTDVSAPLFGPSGAAAVFAPQKGAMPAEVTALDAALRHMAALLGGDPQQPGAGAAGGTAYGFATLWSARIVSGADHIAGLTGLDGALGRADVVLTGEGRFDAQSLGGKVVGRVLDRAAERGIPVGLVAGRTDIPGGAWTASLTDLAGSAESALQHPERWLRVAGVLAAKATELGGPPTR